MLGGVFPLLTHAMFTRMTFAGASSFLGGVVSQHDHDYLDEIPLKKIGYNSYHCPLGAGLLWPQNSSEK